jgi:hypothetical protein
MPADKTPVHSDTARDVAAKGLLFFSNRHWKVKSFPALRRAHTYASVEALRASAAAAVRFPF